MPILGKSRFHEQTYVLKRSTESPHLGHCMKEAHDLIYADPGQRNLSATKMPPRIVLGIQYEGPSKSSHLEGAAPQNHSDVQATVDGDYSQMGTRLTGLNYYIHEPRGEKSNGYGDGCSGSIGT